MSLTTILCDRSGERADAAIARLECIRMIDEI